MPGTVAFARAAWPLLKQTFWKWRKDKASRLAASLAYFTLFSMAPLLLLAVAIAGFVFGQKAAQGEIFSQIQGLTGPSGALVLQDLLKQAHHAGTGEWAGIIGAVALLVGASGVFTELQDALNTVWDVPERPWRGVLAFLKERLIPFAMVLGIGFLLLVSLILSALISGLGKFVGGMLPVPAYVLEAGNFVVSSVVITLLFAMIYDVLPDIRIPWSDVWIGAAVTSLLFSLGKSLIGLYLGQSAIGSAFGASGSLVILLVWVYYSAQIFFFGAEFTNIYSKWRRRVRQP